MCPNVKMLILTWLSLMCLAQFGDNAPAYGLDEQCVSEDSKLCLISNLSRNNSINFGPNTLGQNLEVIIIKNSSLPTIPPVFGGHNKIQVFVMKRCDLRIVQQTEFEQARSLMTLVLQDNSIEELTEKVFYSLIKLEELHLNHNFLFNLHSNTFSGLAKLKYLDLSHNKIRQIPFHLFGNLFSLQYIDLQYNQIEKIENDIFEHNRNLETILLNNNRIIVFESNSFRQLSSLHFLDVSNNPIDKVYLHSVNELRANNIALKELHINGSVTYLSANNNNLKNLDILKWNLITKLELHNNFVTSLSDLGCMRNLAELDLSHNPLESLDVISMSHLSNLVKLNLSATYLRNFTTSTFIFQEKLTELDLSHNHLLSLDLNIFRPLKNLRVLYIDTHNLYEFDYKLLKHALPRLELIVLQKRGISCVRLSEIVDYFRRHHVNVTPGIHVDCKHKSTDSDIKSNSSGQPEHSHAIGVATEISSKKHLNNSVIVLGIIVFILVIVLVGIIFKYRGFSKCDLPLGRIKAQRPTRLEEESNSL